MKVNYIFCMALTVHATFANQIVHRNNVEEVQSRSIKKLLHKRERAIVPEQMISFSKNQVDNEGYPTVDALKSLMESAFLSQGSQVQIKLVAGGTYTDRIYAVSALKGGRRQNVFFLKFSNKIESTFKLQNLQEGHIGRKIVQARYADSKKLVNKENLPVMTWVEHLFTYKNLNTEKLQSIEVSHAAHGESIYDVLKNSKNTQEIKNCSYKFGLSLGTFQQLFMNYNNSKNPKNWTTVVHGDLHAGNAFFDTVTNRIYFIDNETMRGQEPMYLDMILALLWSKQGMSKFDYEDYSYYFFQGYLDAFGQDRKLELAQYFLGSNSDIFSDEQWHYCLGMISNVSNRKNFFADAVLDKNYSNIFINNFIPSNDVIKNYLLKIVEDTKSQLANRLHLALDSRGYQQVNNLIHSGADVLQKDKYGYTVHAKMDMNGDAQMQHVVYQGTLDKQLHDSIERNDQGNALRLIGQGARLYAKDNHNITAYDKILKRRDMQFLNFAKQAQQNWLNNNNV